MKNRCCAAPAAAQKSSSAQVPCSPTARTIPGTLSGSCFHRYTIWKLLSEEDMTRLTDMKKSESKPAA
jgi:hypothetical protein